MKIYRYEPGYRTDITWVGQFDRQTHRSVSVSWMGFQGCCLACVCAELRSGDAVLANEADVEANIVRLTEGDLAGAFFGGATHAAAQLEMLLAAWRDRDVGNVDRLAATLESAVRIGGPRLDRVRTVLAELLASAPV